MKKVEQKQEVLDGCGNTKFQYVQIVDGNADVINDSGEVIHVVASKALGYYNQFERVRRELGFPNLFGKEREYTDPSLIENVRFQNGYIILYTKEGIDDDFSRYMLLLPAKIYTEEKSIREYYQDMLNAMGDKLMNITDI